MMEPNPLETRRKIFIFVSAIDLVLAGIVLLIYFGWLPIDVTGLGIPRWMIGSIGGVWFIGALAVLVYQLTKPDITE